MYHHNIKNLFIIAVFAAFQLGASAQIQLGAKLGVNLGVGYGSAEKQGNNTIESVSPNLGFQGGLVLSTQVTERLGLMAEVNYELNRGNKEISEFILSQTTYADALHPTVTANIMEATGLPEEQAAAFATQELASMGDLAFTTKLKGDQINSFSYINVPILLTLGEVSKLYFGPNIGYVLSGKSTVNTTGRNEHTLTDENLPLILAATSTAAEVISLIDAGTDAQLKQLSKIAAIGDLESEVNLVEDERLNQFVFGLNIGYMYSISENLYLDLRINHDITDLTNNETDAALAEPTFGALREDKDRQVGVQLSVGYRF